MIDGADWFLQSRRAFLADLQEAVRERDAPFAAHPIEPLAKGCRDGRRHALARERRQFPREPMCFLVLDVQTLIVAPFYHIEEPFYLIASMRSIIVTSEHD
jgi:hypothetical protein